MADEEIEEQREERGAEFEFTFRTVDTGTIKADRWHYYS
jgi:hypothetical protein